MLTRLFTKTVNTKYLSWWSSNDKSETGGYHVDYQTPSAEAWYEDRVQKILDEHNMAQKLYCNLEWKTCVCRHGHIMKMISSVQTYDAECFRKFAK